MVTLLGSANLVGIGAFAGGAGRDGQQQNYTNHCFHNFYPCANKLEHVDAGPAVPLGGRGPSGFVASPSHYMIRCQHLDILLALKGRGFLPQDGDVPPRGYCELH